MTGPAASVRGRAVARVSHHGVVFKLKRKRHHKKKRSDCDTCDVCDCDGPDCFARMP